MTPDEFLLRLLEVDVEAVRAVVGEQASGLRHPPMTTEEVLEGLAQVGLKAAVAALRAHAGPEIEPEARRIA